MILAILSIIAQTWKQPRNHAIVEWLYTLYYILKKKKKDFIYSFEKERKRAWAVGGAEGKGEADSPMSVEPDTKLNPRTPRPWPEPKADA